jgi:hypothetical protein
MGVEAPFVVLFSSVFQVYRKFSFLAHPCEKMYLRKVTPLKDLLTLSTMGSTSVMARRIFSASARSM